MSPRLSRVGSHGTHVRSGVPSADGMLCAWYDAGNSASYPGTGAVWTDLSAQARGCTIYGTPAWSAGVFTMDAIDDGMVCAPGGNIPINADPRTLMAVFQTTTVSAGQEIWACGDNIQDGRRTGLWIDASGTVGVECRNTARLTTGTISANTWYVLTAVQVGSNSHDFEIYLNGALQASSGVGTNTALITANNNLVAGYIAGTGYAAPLSGKLAICKLWAGRLSAGQVDHEFQIIRSRFGL